MHETDKRVMIEFLVPATQLSFQPAADDKKHLEIDFSVAAIGKDGKMGNLDSKTVSADLNPETLTKIEAGGLPFRMSVDWKPELGAYRLIIRDKTSMRIGRIDIPLK
jgi:hypothetical protein